MYRIEFMQRALHLARQGTGRVSPNPLVGCVIAREGRIIAEGWHEQFGGPHAEINALRSAAESVEGADIYINLEPCSHFGKTPPCARSLIEAKVGRVFVGTTDPNPAVSGKGIQLMRDAGIAVQTDLMEQECRKLNRFFFHHITTGQPFVILKAAITLDGFIADRHGSSKWISGPGSRTRVHQLRREVDAVLVGAGTVRTDDPQLNVRLTKGRHPRKIVLSRTGNIPPEARLLDERTMVVSEPGHMTGPVKRAMRNKNVTLMEHAADDPEGLLSRFSEMGITSLLVEGGAEVFGMFLENGLVNELRIVTAPLILGDGIRLANLTKPRMLDDAIQFAGKDHWICLPES